MLIQVIVSIRGLKGDILIRALIDCGVETDIITLSLLVYSRLNYNGQRLGGYKTLNYQPLTIYRTVNVLYKVIDSFRLK